MSGARVRWAHALRANAAVFGAALWLAFGVKAFYASASAEALGWILGPTAALVGVLSGQPFEAEPGIGYVSREIGLVIAPACAGLNHLVISFCMLVLGFAGRIRRPGRRWGWLLAAAGLAYTTTLLANAARIALSIALHDAALPAWVSADQAHRLEGVTVYLGSLWLLAFAVARCFARPVDAWHVALLPLIPYLGVTLLVPVANGAYARAEFWEHAREVALASLGLLAVVLAGVAAARRGSRTRVSVR